MVHGREIRRHKILLGFLLYKCVYVCSGGTEFFFWTFFYCLGTNTYLHET